MNAELYYFDGCPSYKQALENLKQALATEGLPQDVKLVRVADAEDAQVKQFIGSPTIRVDCMDVEGLQVDRQRYGFGCRVYAADGKMTGWPSVEQIREALQKGRAEREPRRTR